jgi:hypothetical protein
MNQEKGLGARKGVSPTAIGRGVGPLFAAIRFTNIELHTVCGSPPGLGPAGHPGLITGRPTPRVPWALPSSEIDRQLQPVW